MDWAQPGPPVSTEAADRRFSCVLGGEEAWRLLDFRARRYLGIGGDEFIRRWRTGFYGEPKTIEVAYVSMLIPYAA